MKLKDIYVAIKTGYENEKKLKYKKTIYYGIRLLLLIVAIAGISQELVYGVKDTYTDNYFRGLKEGFDEGFKSGTEYGIGQAVGVISPETRWENATWYYQEGFKRGTITGYQTTKPLNPYIIKEAQK